MHINSLYYFYLTFKILSYFGIYLISFTIKLRNINFYTESNIIKVV